MLPAEQQILILKIGRYAYDKMRERGYELTNQGYKKFKEDNLYEKKQKQLLRTGKNRVRWKTYRYIERHCNLEMKCQICGTTENVEIHHPNYNDYLKINLLCKKHHTDLHNFELIPPMVINLEDCNKAKQI